MNESRTQKNIWKKKRVMQGKRMIFDEIVRLYIEEKIKKFNTAERSLFLQRKLESLILAQDKRWRRT